MTFESISGTPAGARPDTERAFFSVLVLMMTAIVVVGFSGSLFLRPFRDTLPEFAAPEPFFLYHGMVFAAWFALLVAQTTFIRQGHMRSHRTFGMLGTLLALGMVVIGIRAALLAAAREGGFIGVPVPADQFLVVPLTDIAMFAGLVAAAILLRGDPQSHKRLMILATLNILPAALIRIAAQTPLIAVFGIEYLLTDIFVLILVIWDILSTRRIHPVTLWAGLATVISQPLRFWISGTEAWQALAASLLA